MNEAISELSAEMYSILLPLSWVAIAILILFFYPLALIRKARSFAGKWIYASSYLFGITTWFLGAIVTFSTWGWIGLIIGLLFAGVGVVPIGILAAFISLNNLELGISLIIMSLVVFFTRFSGMSLMFSKERQ